MLGALSNRMTISFWSGDGFWLWEFSAISWTQFSSIRHSSLVAKVKIITWFLCMYSFKKAFKISFNIINLSLCSFLHIMRFTTCLLVNPFMLRILYKQVIFCLISLIFVFPEQLLYSRYSIYVCRMNELLLYYIKSQNYWVWVKMVEYWQFHRVPISLG